MKPNLTHPELIEFMYDKTQTSPTFSGTSIFSEIKRKIRETYKIQIPSVKISVSVIQECHRRGLTK